MYFTFFGFILIQFSETRIYNLEVNFLPHDSAAYEEKHGCFSLKASSLMKVLFLILQVVDRDFRTLENFFTRECLFSAIADCKRIIFSVIVVNF